MRLAATVIIASVKATAGLTQVNGTLGSIANGNGILLALRSDSAIALIDELTPFTAHVLVHARCGGRRGRSILWPKFGELSADLRF